MRLPLPDPDPEIWTAEDGTPPPGFWSTRLQPGERLLWAAHLGPRSLRAWHLAMLCYWGVFLAVMLWFGGDYMLDRLSCLRSLLTECTGTWIRLAAATALLGFGFLFTLRVLLTPTSRFNRILYAVTDRRALAVAGQWGLRGLSVKLRGRRARAGLFGVTFGLPWLPLVNFWGLPENARQHVLKLAWSLGAKS